MGQIPRSTERISSSLIFFKYNVVIRTWYEPQLKDKRPWYELINGVFWGFKFVILWTHSRPIKKLHKTQFYNFKAIARTLYIILRQCSDLYRCSALLWDFCSYLLQNLNFMQINFTVHENWLLFGGTEHDTNKFYSKCLQSAHLYSKASLTKLSYATVTTVYK